MVLQYNMLLAGEILYRGLGRYLTYRCPVIKLKTKKKKKKKKKGHECDCFTGVCKVLANSVIQMFAHARYCSYIYLERNVVYYNCTY